MIPLDVRNTGLMLARPAKGAPLDVIGELSAAQGVTWSYEFKWDGIRALVLIEGGTVGTVRIRGRENEITHRYPEVAARLGELYAGRDLVLDGELLCIDPRSGRPVFSQIHRRDAQQSAAKIKALAARYPATFMAFDVLYADGLDFRRQPQWGRYQMLEEVTGGLVPAIIQPTIAGPDGAAMWKLVQQNKMEGLIAKARHAPYRAGRGMDWVKIKYKKSASVYVTGLDPGEGWREPYFGALHMSLFAGSELVSVGKVGTGFSHHSLALVCKHIRSGAPLVIEVEYLNVMAGENGEVVLRQPAFKGIRQDVSPVSCTLDQLDLDEVKTA